MYTRLLLTEIGHLLFYFVCTIPVKLIKKEYFNTRNVLVGTISAFFIDIDHLFDYMLRNGFKFNLQGFYAGENIGTLEQLILPFHGWEFAIITLFIWFFGIKNKKRNSWFLFIVIGYFAHLTFDVISNGITWEFYFITYRLFVA